MMMDCHLCMFRKGGNAVPNPAAFSYEPGWMNLDADQLLACDSFVRPGYGRYSCVGAKSWAPDDEPPNVRPIQAERSADLRAQSDSISGSSERIVWPGEWLIFHWLQWDPMAAAVGDVRRCIQRRDSQDKTAAGRTRAQQRLLLNLETAARIIQRSSGSLQWDKSDSSAWNLSTVRQACGTPGTRANGNEQRRNRPGQEGVGRNACRSSLSVSSMPAYSIDAGRTSLATSVAGAPPSRPPPSAIQTAALRRSEDSLLYRLDYSSAVWIK